MANQSFEEIFNQLRESLSNILFTTEAYLVSDLFAQFTLYLVNPPIELPTHVNETLGRWIKDIEIINNNGFLYEDLQKGKISITDTLFFVNRHSDKVNWFLTANDTLDIQAKVIVFYSFKGGLGRTTALVLSAIHLARQGKKVVLIDFDLEAPGLASLFLSDFPQYNKVNGVTDYMLDLSVNQFKQEELDLASYYFSLNQQEIVGSNNGELIVFPATRTDYIRENSLNYIDKLSKINLQYNESPYIADYLLLDIDKKIQPDFIFIDTRTGVNDIGGLVLHRYANLSFLFFYGNQQNMFGLDAVLGKLRDLNTRFYLVNSPVPREEKTQEEEIQYFLENSYQIFSDTYYKEGEIPDLDDRTADHYPINIPFSDTATFLNNTRKLRILLEEGGKENPYLKISQLILAEQEESISSVFSHSIDSQLIVKAMSQIIDQTAASENEFKTEDDLKRNFYPRRDYRFIFDRTKFLILGEKGAGKTALYAVLAYSSYAKELAKYCETNTQELQNTHWIKGLDVSDDFPSNTNFKALKDLSDTQLRNYWLILLSREVANFEKSPLPFEIITTAKFSELKDLAKDDLLSEKLEEYLQETNSKLKKNSQYLTVVYDYLDRKLTDEDNLRGRLVGALLSLWYEYHNRFSNLKTKIFLREDIYDREIPSGVTDKVKLDNFRQNIEWEQTQLLNLVWKRVIEQNAGVVDALFNEVGLTVTNTSGLGFIPQFNEEQHSLLLEKLFGKRMGSNNKAFPYNWIEQHISDTKGHIQPRSILNLFGLGAANQLIDKTAKSTLIRPYNFEQAMTDVSKNRVRDLIEEYPQFEAVFNELPNHLDKFPVVENQLVEALNKIISLNDTLSTLKPDEIIIKLMDIGVLYEYKYNKKNVGVRYHIPDLYLFGLGLSRRGPGAHKTMFDKNRKRVKS